MVWIPNSTAPRRCDRQRSLGAQGAAYVIVSSLLLGGCQTTDGEVPISEIFGKQYNVFYDQSDHVKGLLQRDEALEASSVYTAEAAFFAGKGKAHDELLGSLRAEVEARYEVDSGPVMEELEATKWPAPPTEWSGIKSNLARAEDLIDELQGHAILSWQNQSPLIVRLDKQASTLRRQIERSAGQQLVAYGFLTDPAFADIYPIEVDMSVTLASVSDELGEALSQAGPNDLIELHARYRYQIPATITSGLAERYVATATAERVEAGDSWLEARILALKAAAAHNLTLSAPVKAEFRAIDISSPTGTGERFDFPVLVTTELPVAFEKTTEKDAISAVSGSSAKAVLLIDVAAANADREITRYEAIASEIQIGTQTVPNPEYATAQSQVVQAQTALQNMQIQKLQIDAEYCTGWACLAKAVAQIAAAAQIDEAQGALSTAMSALHTTPLTRELPIYGSYEFKRAEIVATKTAVANYFVIDRVGKRMFKGSFDLVERREFAVPYGIDQNDRYLYRHLSKFDEEDDVVDFEQEALTVSVDTLIARYMVDPGQTRTVASVAALRKAVVNDRKAVLARFDATPVRAASAGKYDDLANSVVAIVSPNGALGTGFYVADKFVVTNLHVVGDNRLLEIRRKDGEETFGKVIASDVRRDLALIKVDAAGPPVDFLASSDVPVGETVVAIGHPRGLEFSVSQGIVSAVRKTASHAVGGKPVWHIQTDAAMNPGNSGGPLFLGNRVAGVITWARREETDTGLGFAVHYSEVLDFLASQELAPLVRGPAPIPATKPPGGVIDVSVPAAAAND